jgi:hypothetical protein
MRSRAQPKARLSFFLRGPLLGIRPNDGPARNRNGQGGPAPATKKLTRLRRRPSSRPFPDEGVLAGASPSPVSTGRSNGDERMNDMNFVHTERTRPQQVAARIDASTAPGAGRALPRPKPMGARLYASTAPGPGRRPGSKVRTPLRRCAPFSKVRILENPDVFFEDAQAFTRCAHKTAHLRRAACRGPSVRRGHPFQGGPFPDRELPVIPLVGWLRIRTAIGYACQMRSTKWTSGAQA